MAQTREQARIAERKRQERRAARMAQVERQRRLRTVIASAVAVAIVIGAAIALSLQGGDDGPGDPASSPTNTAAATGAPTDAAAPTAPPEPSTDPNAPKMTIDPKATYTATIVTSEGTLTLDLDAAKIPETTNSWKHLADKKFWDGTKCHRMTSGALNVLQCGDPEGTGSGGPGYTIAEENLEGATYGKGVIAMAKTQAPHSTGSQFFINYADSQLPPQYTPVGTVTKDSMDVLDKIKAIGVKGGAEDGAPAKEITLKTVRVEKAS